VVVDTRAIEVGAARLRLQGSLESALLGIVDERTRELVERRRAAATPRGRGWLVRRVLLAADVVALTVAFAFAMLLFGPATGGLAATMILFLAALPIWILLAKLHGLYDRDEERADHSTVHEITAVFQVVTIGCWLFYGGAWLTGQAALDPALGILFWLTAILGVATTRAGARSYCRRQVGYLQNTLIVGAGNVGQLIAHKILQHPEYGFNIVGFVDDEPLERRSDLEHLALLGSFEDLPEIVRLLDVDRVIVAFSNESHEQLLALLRILHDEDVQIDIVPRLFELVGARVDLHSIEGLALVGMPRAKLPRSSRLLKRTLDVAVSAASMVVLSPFFLVVAALIRLESKGPVFFRQVRMGADNRTFRIFKFRTMRPDADERKHEVAHLNMHARNGGDPRMFKVPNDPRVTRVGSFLRRTSLDELPQLINVLKGEMSLVGPRPLILDEDRFVTEWARRRLDLKPGITGLWQVLGRSEIPFDEMTKLDYLYVTNWSLAEDLRLIFLTLPSLLRPRRAY